MNRNIEVINKELWAVKFCFLPYITEIDYLPDPEIPMFEEPGRITNDGLMLLNKDHKGYPLLKGMFPKLMKKSNKQLKKELFLGKRLKNKTANQILYASMVQVEIERRSRLKKAR
ncbi:hypothetical protein [Peribacillus loiseleuriae]|uniref:Uncharacterized protein n=1 Tax=Peribacillus loiseleuriae TaxID=1679170 RepID=A0A0K9GSI1_9BACI|nr:hypothetical protein [Peribacillus loiseleuriae]KMY49237.1 hypothetical protein AC625_06630 [Peribacillus loiseleuriae]